jgi:hypothetical protein
MYSINFPKPLQHPRYAFAAVTKQGFGIVCWGSAIATGNVKFLGGVEETCNIGWMIQ